LQRGLVTIIDEPKRTPFFINAELQQAPITHFRVCNDFYFPVNLFTR